MATSTTASVRFLEAGTPVGPGALVLLRMTGQEELGRLSEFTLDFSSSAEVPPERILGKNITWALEGPGVQRYFNGFVTRFAETGEAGRSHFESNQQGRVLLYQATVHPWLWFLTRASNCRIFQDMTALEIAKKVFADYPFGAYRELTPLRTYPKRAYSVQYRETDLNFVLRLFEQEGIYFFFEYENGKNTLVICDSKAAHKPELAVPFHRQARIATAEEGLVTWSTSREIQAGTYVIEDFDYLNPKNKPCGTKSGDKTHDLAGFQMYDYPGEFGPGEGQQYADTRIEELHARYEQYQGTGDVRLAAPGKLLKLSGHPRTSYNNRPYLLTAVTYNVTSNDLSSGGSAADFNCIVSAIDSRTQFRPLRQTPKPIIQGPQTAIVVGQGQEEIFIDADDGKEPLGRIKVQFHWDRYGSGEANDKSSCWVRVAQPLAGNGWGFFALPRVGQEVVVEFLEGDPDRPLVTGSVYNGDQKPPYALPGEKTRIGLKTHSTTKGTSDTLNELRFEDKKGSEEIYIQAQKDKTINIKKDRVESVGNESHLFVKSKLFEQFDADHHVKVKNNRNEEFGGSLSIKAGMDMHSKAGMLIASEAGMEMHLKAGMTMVLEAGTNITLKCGGSEIVLSPAGISVKGTMTSVSGSGMLALKGGVTMINMSDIPQPAMTGSGAKPEKPEKPKNAPKAKGGDMHAPPKPVPPQAYGPQAKSFEMAAATGAAFCAVCNCPPAA